jgi:ABC-type spermidine/putrescine transport system permease subunit I
MLHTIFATQVGYLTYVFPLVTLLLLASLVNVDRDLVEAANNLGAGRLRSIFTVVIPSAKIGFVFAISFAFILAFGDFVAPTLLGSSNGVTLSILIIDTVKSASNWPQASVVALTMVVTMMVVILASFRVAFPPRKAAR